MCISRSTFDNWHPRYEMAYTSMQNHSESRWLYFKPDFDSNKIVYGVRILSDRYGCIKDREYTYNNLKDALDCYNEEMEV